MSDHPNGKDRLHARREAVDALPDGVAGEYWTATAPVQRDEFGEAGRVPLRVARLAWDAYHAAGHDQPLEVLNRRSGFSWGEIIMLLRGPGHYRAHNHYATCFKDCAKGRDL